MGAGIHVERTRVVMNMQRRLLAGETQQSPDGLLAISADLGQDLQRASRSTELESAGAAVEAKGNIVGHGLNSLKGIRVG